MASPKVAIITGAGGGLGRAEALQLAANGFSVVVNDVGMRSDESTGESVSSAGLVAAEIAAAGGQAIADTSNISTFDGAATLVRTAIDSFGGLGVVVNNAGIVRDSMFVNMTEQQWDEVVAVHLKGTFAVSKHAVDHWRSQSKAGAEVDARIINTASGVGLYGSIGQANYAAAKAAIAALTKCTALELTRYGVYSSAVAPVALTPMTAGLRERTPQEKAAMDPQHTAALVTWLAGEGGRAANGLVFNIKGGNLSVADGWRAGEGVDRETGHSLAELDDVMPTLIKGAQGQMDILGQPLRVG